MFVHKGEAFGKSVAFYKGVRIEQKHAIAFYLPECLIVGFGKTDILLIDDKPHLRKFLPKHRHRAVNGVVVHNPHFGIYALQGLENRVEALFQKELDVVVYYDNA